MIRASSFIQYSADVTFPPTPWKQHPPIPWVWLRGRAVFLDPGNSTAVNTAPGKPGRPFRGTLASSPSPLIRSLRKVIWLPYSFFRWLMKTNHLKFSLNWTPPPIFNMTKWKQEAANEWSPGPHSTGHPGTGFLLGGGGQVWWNRVSPCLQLGGLWALMWGLLPSQVPAIQR